MFSEILKIKPQLDSSDANKMEQALTSRFSKISKKFAGGLGKAILGGGIAGLALGLVDKLLNPLKETQETIDRMLSKSDDIVTNAKQFGTTAGKLLKLQSLGAAAGLDPDALYMLMGKFQTSLAEAQADPEKATSVRNFVGRKDTSDAFFEFIQSLQKMEKGQQILVQQEVFGEKQILKMSDFLNSDFAATLKEMRMRPSEAYTPRLEKAGGLNDRKDTLRAGLDAEDIYRKAGLVNDSMVTQQAARAALEMQRENERIKSYNSLASIEVTSAKLVQGIEKATLELTRIATSLTGFNKWAQQFSISRGLRGIMGGGKDE